MYSIIHKWWVQQCVFVCVCGGMEWNEMEWNGMKWNEMEWNGMKWNGMKWNEMEWNGMEWNGMKWNGMICCVMLCFVTLCYVMLSPSLSLFIAISYHYVMLCYIISRHVMLCYLMYGRLSTQDNSQALGTMFHAPSESWKLKVHPTIWYMKPISGELMWIGAKQNQCKSWMFFDYLKFLNDLTHFLTPTKVPIAVRLHPLKLLPHAVPLLWMADAHGGFLKAL